MHEHIPFMLTNFISVPPC